jgi:hypothetical protein
MATIKKGIKKAQNGLRAKADATSVSRRNVAGEDRMRAKKAKEAKDDADLNKRSVSRQLSYPWGEKSYKLSADTTGYSKGKDYFPGIIHTGTRDKDKRFDKKTTFSREKVDNFIKKPTGTTDALKKGGKVSKAKDGKWIQKAVNPAHKGFCTPMTKATCTPKRKALAKTFKAMGRARKGK